MRCTARRRRSSKAAIGRHGKAIPRPDIAGYDYRTSRTAHSPVTPDEPRALEASVGWTAEDAASLREAGRPYEACQVTVKCRPQRPSVTSPSMCLPSRLPSSVMRSA